MLVVLLMLMLLVFAGGGGGSGGGIILSILVWLQHIGCRNVTLQVFLTYRHLN